MTCAALVSPPRHEAHPRRMNTAPVNAYHPPGLPEGWPISAWKDPTMSTRPNYTDDQPRPWKQKNGRDRSWRAIKRQVLRRDGHECRACGGQASEVKPLVRLVDGGNTRSEQPGCVLWHLRPGHREPGRLATRDNQHEARETSPGATHGLDPAPRGGETPHRGASAVTGGLALDGRCKLYCN